MRDPGRRFEILAEAAEGAVRLGEAALWVAADEYPDLDISAWIMRLDALGHAAARRIGAGMGADEAAAALNALLFAEEGFRGNREAYYDARNSFLNDVLERRLGIPITLSVVYIDVAATAGVRVAGIGLPGHFIVRLTRRDEDRLLDPFNGGAALGEADCHALMREVYGAEVPFDPGLIRPVTTREIVARMLGNLKGIYMRHGDWTRALRAVDRIRTLAPDAFSELRDRGTILARLGETRAAVREWERYLARAPQAPDADRVRHHLRALRQILAVLN